MFTVPIWAIDGSLVDLLYRSEAAWFGNVVAFPVVLAKICVDQFVYNPFFAAPFGVLTYEWKNSGFSRESLVRGFTWDHYRDKIVPTLLATWAVWIPLMAIIYSLPLALQFPLFSLALTFWVLLLTYMTNSFASKNIRDLPDSRCCFVCRDPSALMKTHEIFQHMSPALAVEILSYLQKERTRSFQKRRLGPGRSAQSAGGLCGTKTSGRALRMDQGGAESQGGRHFWRPICSKPGSSARKGRCSAPFLIR